MGVLTALFCDLESWRTDSIYLRKVPSCSLSDLEQFPRHFSLKKPKQKPTTKTTQTEEAASWGHFSICICSARNIGDNAPFYSGPDSVLRAFCGGWKENKMKPLSSSSATVQWPFLLCVSVCSFHPCRFFRPSPYLPFEPCYQAPCTKSITYLCSAAQISRQFSRKVSVSLRHPQFLC